MNSIDRWSRGSALTRRVTGFAELFMVRQLFVCGLALFVASTISGVLASTQEQQEQTQKDHAQHTTSLPDGPGKDELVRACSKCHSPNLVIAKGQDRQGWEDTITKMAGLGAVGTDAEFTDIVDYLVKNFPAPSSAKLNVNKATASELQASLTLTPAESAAVVAYRSKNGDFKVMDDLKKVPQVNAAKFEAKKDLITF